MFGFPNKSRLRPDDRALLRFLLQKVSAMAIDLTKLNAAVAHMSTAVDALVAAHSDPAAQAAVDAAAATVEAKAVEADAAVAPPVVAAPAA